MKIERYKKAFGGISKVKSEDPEIFDAILLALESQIPQEAIEIKSDYLCPRCVRKIDTEDKYCRYCGQRIGDYNANE